MADKGVAVMTSYAVRAFAALQRGCLPCGTACATNWHSVKEAIFDLAVIRSMARC